MHNTTIEIVKILKNHDLTRGEIELIDVKVREATELSYLEGNDECGCGQPSCSFCH